MEIRTQASTTMPLSSTRSKTSIRLDPPETLSTAISGLPARAGVSRDLESLVETSCRHIWQAGCSETRWNTLHNISGKIQKRPPAHREKPRDQCHRILSSPPRTVNLPPVTCLVLKKFWKGEHRLAMVRCSPAKPGLSSQAPIPSLSVQ